MDTYKLKWTKLEQEIFSLLCQKAGEKLSQRDIAKSLKVSPTAVSNSLKNLIKFNLLKIEKTKTINFICFNRENPKAIQLKRVENLKRIYETDLVEILEENFPGCTIILFGSFSRGEDTLNSDIDLAVINSKNKELNLEKYEKFFDREIYVHTYKSLKEIDKELKSNILAGINLVGVAEI